MKDYLAPLLSLTQTRKFWVAVVGALVTYITVKFGTSPELTLGTSILTAFGVYGVPNGE